MYNYCQLVGRIEKVNKTTNTISLKLRREFKNGNGEFENYTITVNLGNVLGNIIEEADMEGKVVLVKGRLEPTSDGASCKMLAERIISMSDTSLI